MSKRLIAPAIFALATSAVRELYRDWQLALAQYGGTPYTLDFQFEFERMLSRERGISLLPGEQLDAALDQLHIQAFPDPKDRPPRMTAGDTVDPRTDYTE